MLTVTALCVVAWALLINLHWNCKLPKPTKLISCAGVFIRKGIEVGIPSTKDWLQTERPEIKGSTRQ